MKLTFILLFTSIGLIYAADTYSQSARLSFDLNNKTVQEVLDEIEKQSEFKFFYNNNQVDMKRKVSANADNLNVFSVLLQLFENTDVTYKVLEKSIILSTLKKKASSLPTQQPQAGEKTIKGVITDKRGESIIGAHVLIKGTRIGVVTGFDGSFQLNVPANTTLEISSIGYNTLLVNVDGKSTISVQLEEDVQALDEIVVVGFGTQKKVNLTGAVSSISGDEMTKRPVANAASMLQGQIPGVRVSQGVGQPGAEGITIRVRGQGTFSSAGSNPLVLINGVPGDLSSLDPSIIESVSVLKDAASASIYGARAANGVILVTTKQGAVGSEKPTVSYHANFGVHSPTKMYDLVTNSVQYMELANLAKTNSGNPDRYPETEIEKYRKGNGSEQYPNFDWLGYMFNPAPVQSHNLSLAGSSERSTYNVALNYVNQDGTMRGFSYKKYNLSLDLTSKVTDWMKVGTYATMKSGDVMRPRQGQGDAFLSSMSQAPTYMPWLPDDGTAVKKWTYRAYNFEQGNKNMPAIIGTNTMRPSRDYDFNAQIWAEINLTKNLIWHTKGATRYFSEKWQDWRGQTEPLYYYHTGEYAGDLDKGGIGLSEGHKQRLYVNLYTYLRYDVAFNNKDHSLSAMIGYSNETDEYETLEAYRRDYPFELPTINAGGKTGWSNGGGKEEWALMSVFGRVNYNYKERYLAEVNMRYDGSSRIAEDGRWGLFPSFSLGWRLTEEQFIKDLNWEWLTNTKIRGSWGELGNQNIGLYPYQAMISSVSAYPFDKGNESLSYIQKAYANNKIKWETTTITDIGVDLQLFSKLNVTFDWYKKNTTDILRKAQVSNLLGLEAPYINNGELENTGIELALNWYDMIHSGAMEGLQYNVGVFFDRSRNKLTKFGQREISGYSLYEEGKPYGEYYMLDCIGVFATDDEIKSSPKQFNDNTQAGDLKFRDANNDGVVNNDDRVTIEGRFPSFEYSLNLGLNWKGIDLSLIGQGVAGKKFYTSGWGMQPFRQGSAPTMDYIEGMWTPENPYNAEHPKLYWDNFGGSKNTRSNSYFLQNASYFRLKNLTIGYTLPKEISNKISMSKLRFYFSGDNLATISKFRGLDPERAGDGLAAQYPQNRILSVGINVEF